MADEDFDLESLAAYLHLSTAQVAKLAERNQIPGRRVGRSWRFSQPEIHHWLESRIGLSDSAELIRVEGALERHAAGTEDEATVSIAAMLPLAAIQIPLAARTRNSVITSMVELAAQTGLLWDTTKMADAVRSREELYPTALENGAALLHPRRPLGNILGEAFIALGITSRGIPFASSRGLLTDVFFLICSIDDRGHLRTLARLSRLLATPNFLDALRAAPDAAAAHAVFVEVEGKLPQ